MWGYAIVSARDEKERSPTVASAPMMTAPWVRRAGGVTTNVAVAESPADAAENGADEGVDVQPVGKSSFTVPLTDRFAKLVVVTTRRCGCAGPAVGTTRRFESKPTESSGTTFRSRRSSPRTRSANR